MKVQLKQGRQAEQHHQELNHGAHVAGGGGGGGRGGGYHQHQGGGGRGRGGRGAFNGRGGGGANNLPPPGTMVMPSTGWYDDNDINNPPGSPSAAPVAGASAEAQHVVVVLGDGPSNSANVTTAETVGTSVAVTGPDEQQPGVTDPLSSMDPLRHTLPDIGGVATPAAVPGEN